MNRQRRNCLLLLLTALIWGMAFVSQSKGMDSMQPFTFNGARSLIGTLTLLVYIFISRRVSGDSARSIEWGITIRAGILCGLALTVASTLQQFGIQYTTVGKASFITTLYIIFVPLAGIFFKRKVAGVVWVGAVLAATGMYLLCMTESLQPGKGDIAVFAAALAFAGHIMLVDYYAPKTDGVLVSCIQFAVCGVVCTGCAFVFEQPSAAQLIEGAGSLLYAGVLSCGVAYTLQIVGQKGVNPTVAAMLLSLESVVAAVSGQAAYEIGLLKMEQSLTGRQIAGCVLVFSAVVLVQLPEDWFHRSRHK